MARVNGRYEPQAISPMESDFEGGGGGGGGGGISDLYATLGSRVADLPGFGTMWGSFAELGEMQYEHELAERRAIPEAADAAPLAAEATPSVVRQVPDLSGHEVRLTPPDALPSGQIPLDVVRTSSSLPPPPPPSSAGYNVAARQGVDRAAQLRSQVTGQAANPTSTARANGENSPSISAPPLPPLSAESLREFNGGSIIVPVHATDTPQTVARRQLEMMVAAVGQNRRLEAEDQRAFVEEWSQRGLSLSNYEADGTRREFTAEEFRAAQTAGSTFLQLRADWQPRIVADLRRLLELSEPVRVETNEPRMTREEQRVAGRQEAEQQLVDFYRMQANAGIGLLNGTLQLLSMQPNLTARTEDGTEVPIGGQSPQLPYLELQSEYFRGGRGQVAQTAATFGAGIIAAGGMARAGAPSITAEAQAVRQVGMFRSDADPLQDVLGPARLSHSDEYASIIRRLERDGVEIRYRENGLAYWPIEGRPGQMILDPNASIGAIRHETRHYLDVRDAGFPNMGYYYSNLDDFWRLEFRGYMEEIRAAREIRDFNSGRRIVEQMRQRRQELLER